MNKYIKKLEELKLVGFRVVCEGDQYINEIPKAAKRLQDRTSEIQHVLNSGKQVGAFVVEETTPEDEGYWVCVQVEEFAQIPEGMVTLTIPPQKYAAIMHKDSSHLIGQSYETLHKWIAEHGMKRSLRGWNLEFYQSVDPGSAQLEVELCDSIHA
ncbi:GyrI-like domain-containing protein [Salinibacillus xinjiangensis]|uniref:AraC family transcriptional regulator n=1 Tax=Salinibacillus xinjiangensis TaxID=1229268 RepID=A0A6G1X570_9BACI|nr:GyrI-like domain-containing protein [Salinibacillus xinjiangensis]MRG86087.1 AraC family transcriptional regulator [Salinibacillus xinjiangensis]